MFKTGDVVKFMDRRSTSVSASSWEILSDCKANVYEIRDTKKDIKINLIAFGEWLVLDEEYYRKMKLKKICSKLGKR